MQRIDAVLVDDLDRADIPRNVDEGLSMADAVDAQCEKVLYAAGAFAAGAF